MKDLPFIEELISVFEKLPGVGHKTATRYAYYVIEKYSLEDIEKASDILLNTMSHIHKCHECGMFTTSDLCDICKDPSRDHQKVLVVKDYKDLIYLCLKVLDNILLFFSNLHLYFYHKILYSKMV